MSITEEFRRAPSAFARIAQDRVDRLQIVLLAGRTARDHEGKARQNQGDAHAGHPTFEYLLRRRARRAAVVSTGHTLAMEQDVAVADLAAQFRATLLAMHECRVSEGGSPRRWNRLVNEMQSIHLRLRETEEGRRAITALVEDECPTVRQWAATNALAWSPAIARAELERQASADGLSSFDAQMTLREFDAGRLDTAWQPKR